MGKVWGGQHDGLLLGTREDSCCRWMVGGGGVGVTRPGIGVGKEGGGRGVGGNVHRGKVWPFREDGGR